MKRVPLIFVFSVVILVCAFTRTALGQQITKGTAPDPAVNALSVEYDAHSFASGGVRQAKAHRFGVDYAFNGMDGAVPTAALIQDAAGNLYGTTSSGGSGVGVVFKLDTSNHESVLHTFAGPDGAVPHGSLVLDSFGNLYGTTSSGGAFDLGTVFKIDTSGTESVLHSFAGNPDGARPYAGLAMDSSGNLYGTTEHGGSSGFGTIFKIDTVGSESVVHSFTGGSKDGADPKARLTLDTAGNLYGTTLNGGSDGYGTVFELDATSTETVLYNFTGASDGGNPFGSVTLGTDGTLYGTATSGGIHSPYGCCKVGGGVVFSLTGASQQVLYTFTGGNDGGTPTGDLVLYNDVVYGTTQSGGPGHRGTAFSVDVASGNETVLHGFTGKADGGTPQAGLFMNAAGVLYGTAQKGGRFKRGTVFQYKK